MRILKVSYLSIFLSLLVVGQMSEETQVISESTTISYEPVSLGVSLPLNLSSFALSLPSEQVPADKFDEPAYVSAGAVGTILILAVLIALGASRTSFLLRVLLGVVVIKEDQVGIVIKKVELGEEKRMGSERVIAFDGEAGIQADILPPGMHRGLYSWKYNVLKESWVVIPQGEIALIIAQDGAPIPAERALGKVVDCESFQDAQAFLKNGGEKGQQLAFLTTGTYRINTKLFTVITAGNADQYGLKPEQLRPCTVQTDKVGIVTTHDGKPIPSGEIAGPKVEGHNKFQDPQKFVENGGCRGLQQEILPSGTWDLNPWFVEVEQVPLVDIPGGAVGVVIAHVGQLSPQEEDDLVDSGFKGVWKTPLRTGKHPINTKVMSVEIVPTHEIALDWRSDRSKNPANYDASLSSLNLRARDGFPFDIEVTQVIKVPEESAPRMISRVGSPLFEADGHPNSSVSGDSGIPKYKSIKNLVTRVLKPMVENHFRNSVQQYGVLEFLDERSDRQREAALHIKESLIEYGVESVGTYLNEIGLPTDLEKTLTERKIAEQRQETVEAQYKTKVKEQRLAREEEITKLQEQLVKAEKGLEIARLEADAQKLRGIVDVDILQKKIEAFGAENYAAIKIMETVSQNQMRLVPELSFDNKDNYGSVLIQWLIGSFLKPRGMDASEETDEGAENHAPPFSSDGLSQKSSSNENLSSGESDVSNSEEHNFGSFTVRKAPKISDEV
ncbi:MAG: SPFH domain-containing protein [Cyanobacteria bacterium P01_F01_bin.150]